MRRAWLIAGIGLALAWVIVPTVFTSLGLDVTLRFTSGEAYGVMLFTLGVTVIILVRVSYRRPRLRRTWALAAAGLVGVWVFLPFFVSQTQSHPLALVFIVANHPVGVLWFLGAFLITLLLLTYVTAQAGRVAEANRRRLNILTLVQDQLIEGVALFDQQQKLMWANAAGRRYLLQSSAPRTEVTRLLQRSVESRRSTAQSLTLSETERINVQVAPTPDGAYSVIARPLQNESDAATLFYERFMRRIVHDMRNPLAAVIAHAGNLRALEDGQSSATDWRATAYTIETEAQRLTRLVDSLLFDARLSYVPPALQKLDLLDLIEEVYFQHDERAIREGKTLEIDSSLKSAPLEGDQDLLARALSNLVDNSLKYSRSGAQIRVSLEKADDQYVIRVVDTGDGIPPELLPDKIFEALVRGRPHDSGSGLGLSIVKKIVELHHGSISAESIVGKGTIITLWLPI